MTDDAFWTLIEQSSVAAGSDLERQVTVLGERVAGLECDEIESFHLHFDSRMARAYHWDVWAAAYIVRGGCSDDSFDDFRGSLIALGRQVYDAVVRDSDALRDVLDRLCLDDPEDELFVEGFQSIAPRAFEERCPGRTLPSSPSAGAPIGGKPWDDQSDDLALRCPRLWNRCGPQDDSAARALAAARAAFSARDFGVALREYSKIAASLGPIDEKKLRYCQSRLPPST